ncbi:MAG: helix-turn-helix transcriptional regulator [Bacteroidetes bacterium]|nr:helix-turn-helix transcriptional regulator [Bacteroidota bacterium]
MKYKEIIPGERLRPFIKCYYSFESESDIELDDTVFPGGHMEIIFNLGDGIWRSASDGCWQTTPPVELWGKITQPLAIRSIGINKMLGIKFYAHSAALFLNEELSGFNDQIADLRDLLGHPVRTLHERLKEKQDLNGRVALLEDFLLSRLTEKDRRVRSITMVGKIIREMQHNPDLNSIRIIAGQYNISSRYLGKLFLQYTGVTPKLYDKIRRFQQSLRLITENQSSFTAIAYNCGYFDQSHFIRDFKQFAGFTPSSYSPASYPVGQVLVNS